MQKGFTLVELAIVIVIIGLLVGGVLQGQELIRASQRNSVMADLNSFQAAIQLFKSKFNALPGDMRNASTIWPACNTLGYCDGNGDNEIRDDTNYEDMKMWQHLAYANLIKGSYTGVGTDNIPSERRALGINIPASRVPNAGYMIDRIGAGLYSFNNFHLLWAGLMVTNASSVNNRPNGGIMSPDEAMSFDQKFDDGNAALGIILVRNHWVNGHANVSVDKTDPTACVNANQTDLTAPFNTSVIARSCLIGYRLTL